MSFTKTASSQLFTSNGVSPSLNITDFYFVANSHVQVTVYLPGATTGTRLTEYADYTLTGAGNAIGGQITWVSGKIPANLSKVFVNRVVPIDQETDYEDFDGTPSDVLENDLDLAAMRTQQLQQSINKSIRLPDIDPLSISSVLPQASLRLGKALVFDAVSGAPAISADDYVDQLANVTTEALAAAMSATAAANSASISSSAAASTAGSVSAAAVSATAAAGSASAASTSAITATNQATAASTSATTATNQASAASTSATNASNSATAAGNSASAASTSASAASTSATNAHTSENNAGTSATAAANALASTLAAFHNFNDIYYGAYSSDPTTDPDGNAPNAGDIYFNTVAGAMKIYTGSAWVAAYVSGSGYLAAANNLSDLASVATARGNLGLGTMATQNANAVAINGGTIKGLTTGSANAITWTGGSYVGEDSGYLLLQGIGQTSVGSNGGNVNIGNSGSGTSFFNSATNTFSGAVTLGTALSPLYGGTGLTALAAGDIIYGSAANTYARLAKGTTLQQLRMNAAGTFPEWFTPGAGIKYAIIEDQKTNGTAGGTFTNGAYRLRDLNTSVVDDIGITLASNMFTLPAGTYMIRARAPGYAVNGHQCAIYDNTNGLTVKSGESSYNATANGENMYAQVEAKVVIASATQYGIYHQCQSTFSTSGLGASKAFSNQFGPNIEIYTRVVIEKYA